MQLIRWLLVLLVAAPAVAHADGTLSMRGVWYKEKATRVIQPMLDATFEVGDAGEADAHMLVDAITSASVAAGIFSERRWELGGGYRHQFERVRVGGSVRGSYEPDYQSVFGGLLADTTFADQTTTIGAAFGAGYDDIGKNVGALAPAMDVGSMTTLLGSVSVTQVLTTNTVGGLTYDLIYLDGYQANPYRSAITADGFVDERHPEERWRNAIAGTIRRFVPRTGTTLIATYRFYADSWDLEAHTPELRIVQEAGDGVDATLRYRYHRQSAASFYLPSYPSNDRDIYPYVTDDVKLSAFTSHTIGAKIGVYGHVLGITGSLEEARGELILEYTDQNNRFGNAVQAHAALTLPLEY